MGSGGDGSSAGSAGGAGGASGAMVPVVMWWRLWRWWGYGGMAAAVVVAVQNQKVAMGYVATDHRYLSQIDDNNGQAYILQIR